MTSQIVDKNQNQRGNPGHSLIKGPGDNLLSPDMANIPHTAYLECSNVKYPEANLPNKLNNKNG